MKSEEFKSMRDKALQQLMSGQSLTGKDGVFAPLLQQFLEIEGEMSSHLTELERSKGNKRNGKGTKTLKTSSGEVTIAHKTGRAVLNLKSSENGKLFLQTTFPPRSSDCMAGK